MKNASSTIIKAGATIGIALLVLATTNGCAVFNRDNTPAFNFVENHLTPEDETAQIVALPVVAPLGLAALTLDAAVIHPTLVIKEAGEKTQDALWDQWDWDDEYMSECAGLPWRAAFTPPVYLVNWIGLAFFDTSDKARDAWESRQEKTGGKELDRTQVLMRQDKPAEALDLLDAIESWELEGDDVPLRALLRLRATYESGQYEDSHSSQRRDISAVNHSALKSELQALLHEMAESEKSLARREALNWQTRHIYPPGPAQVAAAQKALFDPDPVLRSIESRFDSDQLEILKPDLERVAAEDSNELNRFEAQQVLKSMSSRRPTPPHPSQ